MPGLHLLTDLLNAFLRTQGRAQEDVEAQTFGIVKINTINNTITLAQLNAAVSKYAVYTSITAASIKNTGAAPTVTVNETANTITVTFRNNKPGVAFLTVSGAGNLTRTGSKLNKFSQNATTGIITGSVKVVSTKVSHVWPLCMGTVHPCGIAIVCKRMGAPRLAMNYGWVGACLLRQTFKARRVSRLAMGIGGVLCVASSSGIAVIPQHSNWQQQLSDT